MRCQDSCLWSKQLSCSDPSWIEMGVEMYNHLLRNWLVFSVLPSFLPAQGYYTGFRKLFLRSPLDFDEVDKFSQSVNEQWLHISGHGGGHAASLQNEIKWLKETRLLHFCTDVAHRIYRTSPSAPPDKRSTLQIAAPNSFSSRNFALSFLSKKYSIRKTSAKKLTRKESERKYPRFNNMASIGA